MEEDPISLSRRYCDEFNQDMVHLHCLPPSVEPRVSDHIPQIIDMIKQVVSGLTIAHCFVQWQEATSLLWHVLLVAC